MRGAGVGVLQLGLLGEGLTTTVEKHGSRVARIKGSHSVMRHPDGRGTTVPVHKGRDVAKGTLRGILRDVDLTIDDLDL